MTSSEELPDKLDAPAITICAHEKGKAVGFKDVLKIAPIQHLKGNLISQMCEGKEGPEIIDCIEDRALDKTSAIEYLTRGVQKERSLPPEKFWTEELSHTLQGICSTIQPPFSLGTTLLKDAIWIGLNESYDFAMVIHDPNFFLINYTPSLPMRSVMFSGISPYMTQRIVVVQHHRVDVPYR